MYLLIWSKLSYGQFFELMCRFCSYLFVMVHEMKKSLERTQIGICVKEWRRFLKNEYKEIPRESGESPGA